MGREWRFQDQEETVGRLKKVVIRSGPHFLEAPETFQAHKDILSQVFTGTPEMSCPLFKLRIYE